MFLPTRFYQPTAALGGVAARSEAYQAIADETDGLALSFTDTFFLNSTGHYGSARVKHPATPANNYNSHPFGLCSYPGASVKYCRGPDGNLRYGAHNLLSNSENLAAVFTDIGGVTIDGHEVIESDEDESHYFRNILMTIDGLTYAITFRVKSNGKEWISIGGNNPAVSNNAANFNVLTGEVGLIGANIDDAVIADAGDGYYDCTIIKTLGGPIIGPFLAFRNDNSGLGRYQYQGDGVSGVIVARVHVRRVPSDPTYLKTTDSAVYELPFEWDTNGDLLGVVDPEPQATNLALWSNDLTQSDSWTASDITAAKTATGPDGVENSATTLTATDANGTILQAITSEEAERITSCYIKRRTGTGDIDLTQDNGSTWTTVTVTSEWTRVNIAAATLANPTVGIRIVTSGDEVDVSLFQHELGDTVTSPIETAGSTVTRAADVFGPPLTAFPWNSGNGTYTVNGETETPADDGTILTLAAPDGHTHIKSVKWIPSS